MARILRRFFVISASILGLFLILFAAFLAWRIPREREEQARFERFVRRDDGPFVTWLKDGRVKVDAVRFDRVRREYTAMSETLPCEDARLRAAAIEPDAEIDCATSAARGAASFPIEAATHTAPAVAALSDIHGHANHVIALLQAHRIIDARHNWTFGPNHLVVAGDIVDKGPETIRALWLIRKLERQARGAGGRVHYLLGNHEHLALNARSRVPGQKYAEILATLGQRYEDWFGPDTELGRWIAAHGVVVRVNDSLFVHGGLSPEVLQSGLSVGALNQVARATVRDAWGQKAPADTAALGGLVWGRGGLVTFRGYFQSSLLRILPWFRGDLKEGESAGLVGQALNRFGVRRVVVGHTETHDIQSFHGGRLIGICQRTNPEDVVDGDSHLEMLLIEEGRAFRLRLDGSRTAL